MKVTGVEINVFLSQPMRDKSKKEIMDERVEVLDKLRLSPVYVNLEVEKWMFKYNVESINFKILDTYFEDFDESCGPLYYLGRSIELMDKADIVVMMPGWRLARGCVVEHEAALKYDIPIVYL